MKFENLNPWDVSPVKALQVQQEMRARLIKQDMASLENLRIVAGVDNAYIEREGETLSIATVVALSFPKLDVIETRWASLPVSFPYIPGLLAFREAPAILAACQQLEAAVDVFLFDAHGYAHFRRFGAASHLGVVLDRPSIGCAKSRLVGIYEEPGPAFGDYTFLTEQGEVIGAAVRSRAGHSPLFVSVGHKISLETAIRTILACCLHNRFLPEPTYQAHRLVTAYAKSRCN
jgi:deoxyribonuclease V